MKYSIYWLISEDRKRTYIGFTDNIQKRTKTHLANKVKTTKNFGKFRCLLLEIVNDLESARKREKYWK